MALVLLTEEFDNEILKAAPQIKTEYGLFIYRKESIILANATRRTKEVTERKYKKVNRKSYKNLTWLDRMYERRKKETPYLNLLKVIFPLEFPNNYKLYDQNGEYYGTVINKNDFFLYIVTRFNKTPSVFLRDGIERYYIQAQDGKHGMTVPLEFMKDYERSD